jgi:hypothetical protein
VYTEPDDFEDEKDVGLTLTLPDSETDLFVPEPDEEQTDENEYADDEWDPDSPEVWRVMKVSSWGSDDGQHNDAAVSNVGSPVAQPSLSAHSLERSSKTRVVGPRSEPWGKQSEWEDQMLLSRAVGQGPSSPSRQIKRLMVNVSAAASTPEPEEGKCGKMDGDVLLLPGFCRWHITEVCL